MRDEYECIHYNLTSSCNVSVLPCLLENPIWIIEFQTLVFASTHKQNTHGQSAYSSPYPSVLSNVVPGSTYRSVSQATLSVLATRSEDIAQLCQQANQV